MSKPHWSPTQLDMACRCPEAYRRRYIEGEKIPPGIAALKGRGLHGGAQVNMRQKLESHADMPVADIVDAAVSAARFEIQANEYALTPEEQARGQDTVIGETIDQVAALAEVHGAAQAPDYQPILVEHSVTIALPNSSRDLLGIIDLADDKDRVIDFKTSSKKKNQAEADESVQLTTYAAAFAAVTGRKPAGLRLDVIVQGASTKRQEPLDTTRGAADFKALANRINAVDAMVSAGTFLPATPGAWWCSPKWCGYWNTCPYVNSERKAAAKAAESEPK